MVWVFCQNVSHKSLLLLTVYAIITVHIGNILKETKIRVLMNLLQDRTCHIASPVMQHKNILPPFLSTVTAFMVETSNWIEDLLEKIQKLLLHHKVI